LPSEDIGRNVQRAALAVALVLLLAFVIVFLLRLHAEHKLARETRAAATAIPTVDVVTVRGAPAGGSLTLPGETAAWYESTIYARVSGYVAKWYVDIGDHVKAGQVLALIDTPELDAEFLAAKAKLKVSEAQVKVKQADAAFAASTYERWRDSPKGVVSDQEREDKKAGNAGAAAQLEAARAQVNLDQADVDRLSAFEQFKRVTAPYTGTITERRIDIGNLVTAGSASSTTSLYRMSQTDPLRVFVDVPQSAAEEMMQPGMPAEIRAAGSAAGRFAGKITRSAQAINAQARTMRVEVDVPNADHALVPGMYVTVAFQLKPKGSVEIPAAALIFRPGTTQVARVGADGKVAFANVTIARDNGSLVELASGVNAGDRLILNISSQISEGETVAVTAGTGG
jgi:RND family efflux transporter MFP subunit